MGSLPDEPEKVSNRSFPVWHAAAKSIDHDMYGDDGMAAAFELNSPAGGDLLTDVNAITAGYSNRKMQSEMALAIDKIERSTAPPPFPQNQ